MKKGKLRKYAIVEEVGEMCPKCDIPMERRKRIKPPINKTYFFTKWDYCPKCSRVQHYEKFKSQVWQEDERQQDFFRNLK